jgi:hypothetical protein
MLIGGGLGHCIGLPPSVFELQAENIIIMVTKNAKKRTVFFIFPPRYSLV